VNRAPALTLFSSFGSLFRRSLSSLAAITLAFACADLKTADPSGNGGSGNGDGGASSSSGSSSGGGETSSSGSGTGSSSGNSTLGPAKGAGDYGALPFGYCCTSDSECRDRHCVQVGSQKMCQDECGYPETCQGKGLPTGFTCNGTPSDRGQCVPPSGFTCLPANTFTLGTKPAMSCCTPTGNGTAGLECMGGHCEYYKESQDPNYEPPEFCTNHCDVPADCGKGMKCQLELGLCVPANETFTCD